MSQLTLAMRYSKKDGEPLPSPFTRLSELKALHRRGQMSLMASASGGMKSAYALYLSMHGTEDGITHIPTLYFSADCPKMVQGTRVGASLLDKTTDQIEEMLKAGDEKVWAAFDTVDNIEWCWDSSLTTADIDLELEAYAHKYGAYPELIVVDNLINIQEYNGDLNSKDMVMEGLHYIASNTNSHVLVLSHVTKSYVNGNEPVTKMGLLDAPDKRARLILTTYKSSPGMLGICVIKNTTGPADATARLQVHYGMMAERMWFSD